jgi:hypothetical protein
MPAKLGGRRLAIIVKKDRLFFKLVLAEETAIHERQLRGNKKIHSVSRIIAVSVGKELIRKKRLDRDRTTTTA